MVPTADPCAPARQAATDVEGRFGVAQASGPVLLFDYLRGSRGETTQAGRPVPHGTSRNKNAIIDKNSSRPTKRRGFSSTGLRTRVGPSPRSKRTQARGLCHAEVLK